MPPHGQLHGHSGMGARCVPGLLSVLGVSVLLTYLLTFTPQGAELLLRGRVKVSSSTTKLSSKRLVDASDTNQQRLYDFFAAAYEKGLLSVESLAEVEHVITSSEESLHVLDPHAAVQEDNYWRGRHRRDLELEKFNRNFSNVKPFDWFKGLYIWDFFSPDYVCSSMERLGVVGDGGKWVCGLEALKRRRERGQPCIVYSFGVNTDTSFEEELVNRTHCQVFAFDPTVANLPNTSNLVTGPRIQFFKQALGPADQSPSTDFLIVRNLHSIMKELGHTYIDVLKVDVEGAEWEVFEQLFESGTLPFGQLLIELHYHDVPSTFKFFQGLERAGYRVFSRESNYYTCVAPGGKHLPTAIEYSFIDPSLFFSRAVPSKFAGHIAALPDTRGDKPNAVVYLLARRDRIKRLKHMLSLFDSNFNDRYHYPLVIFHDDFTAHDMATVRASTHTKIEFHQVSFEVPSWLDPAKIPERTPCSPHSSTVGYRHMCRFLGLLVQDILSPRYEWHWRLDDDSEVLSQVGYDPIRLMRDTGKLYGFNRVIADGEHCVDGLWNLTKDFANERGISPTFLDSWRDGAIFYNNFEISHASLWKMPIVRDYLEVIDKNGGIYYTRWGDAPIRSLAVAMVLQESEVHRFSDFPYAHRPFHVSEGEGLPAPHARPFYHLEAASDFLEQSADLERLKALHHLGEDEKVPPLWRKPRASVVIFSHGSRFEYLKRLLSTYEENFNKQWQYPVHIMANNLTYQQRLELRSLVSTRLRIEPLNGLSDDATSWRGPATAAASSSCPYHRPGATLPTATFLETPKVLFDRYDWLWRLPDTAVFTRPVEEDVFRTLQQGFKAYGAFGTHAISGGVNGSCVGPWISRLRETMAGKADDVGLRMWRVDAGYFDAGMDITYRRVYEEEPFGALLRSLKATNETGWDEGLLKTLAVMMAVQDTGDLYVFPPLGIDFSAYQSSLPPYQQPAKMADGVGSRVTLAGRSFNVETDATSLTAAFAPRRVGYLEGKFMTVVRRPSPSGLSDGGDGDELLWFLGPTLLGASNRTLTEMDTTVRGAVAVSTSGSSRGPVSADFYTSLTDAYRPQDMFASAAKEQSAWPRAAAMVVPPSGPAKLIVLASRVNNSLVEGDRGKVVGTVLAVVDNPRSPPSRWRYRSTRLPERLGLWHIAMALSSGDDVSTDPEHDTALLLGEALPRPYREAQGPGPIVLARVPVRSLLNLTLHGMELWRGQGRGWEVVEVGEDMFAAEGDGEEVADAGSEEEKREEKEEEENAAMAGHRILPSHLRAMRVNLAYSRAIRRWVIADLDEERRRVVVWSAEEVTGPWTETAVAVVPRESLALHHCRAVFSVPALAEIADGELPLVLICERTQIILSTWSRMNDPIHAMTIRLRLPPPANTSSTTVEASGRLHQ